MDILSRAEKKRFAWLAMVVFVMAILEVVGVASILPFIQLIADPGIVDRSDFAHEVYVYFDFDNVRQMMIWAGIGVIVLLCFTNGFTVYKVWLQHKVAWETSHHLSMRLLRTYLARPYAYFLNRNTSEFMAYIKVETTALTTGVMIPVVEILSRLLVALLIFAALIAVDPEVALLMFGSLGSAYLIIYFLQRRYLRRIGEERITYSVARYVSLQELFDGIKTVQAFNRDDFFSRRYEDASQKFTDLQPVYNVMVAAPRALLEVLAFGAIVVVTIYLYLSVGDIINIIPRLSLYALAGYRVLPSLQKAFASLGKLIHSYPVLEKLHASLYDYRDNFEGEDADGRETTSAPGGVDHQISQRREGLVLNDRIAVKDATFSYENNEGPTLKDINLHIEKGETVAFVGSTGSGKTTLIDVLIGLLTPQSGEVTVDGRPLSGPNVRAWRESVAYVPQDVFLFDDSVAHNITLQETLTGAERERMQEAARLADIHDFIASQLSDGYATSIGEKGVRLSGGQRQRLGLARAFYHQPSVLLLDEATSALDNVTERGILDSLDELPEEITIIVIAHRLSTVRNADRIYLMRDGEIVAYGTYDELVRLDEEFQQMARMA